MSGYNILWSKALRRVHTSELGVVNKLRKREITVSRVFAYV